MFHYKLKCNLKNFYVKAMKNTGDREFWFVFVFLNTPKDHICSLTDFFGTFLLHRKCYMTQLIHFIGSLYALECVHILVSFTTNLITFGEFQFEQNSF